MARVVYLHVGTAKSGTTYLQHMLSQHRDALRRNDYLYPGRRRSHFMESLSLRDVSFRGYTYPESQGAWARVAEVARDFHGDVLISHETLANTLPTQIEHAVQSLGTAEIRVVITCRDLGRQIPAVYQERVKNGNPETYRAFLDRLFRTWSGPKTDTRVFWRSQNLVELGYRWGQAVGDRNVRFVTVPPPGAAPDQLWHRFAQAVDLPALDWADTGTTRNASLGAAETELLRRMNMTLPEDLEWPRYESLIKHRLVPRHLVPMSATDKLVVPEEFRESTIRVAEEIVARLGNGRHTVIGDLEELQPSFGGSARAPEDFSSDELLAIASGALLQLALDGPTGGNDSSIGTRSALSLLRRELGRTARRRLGSLGGRPRS